MLQDKNLYLKYEKEGLSVTLNNYKSGHLTLQPHLEEEKVSATAIFCERCRVQAEFNTLQTEKNSFR